MPVEAEGHHQGDDPTFVRLFVEPDAGVGVPQHVIVKKDSKVEMLAAKVKIVWDDSGEITDVGIDDELTWLKVWIDGKEGWIHTQEDFLALGIPQAGRPCP